MPRHIDSQAYETVLQALAAFPEGASISQLVPILPFSKRTLQRRIDDLSATVQNWISCRSKTGQGVRACNALIQRAKRLLEGVQGPKIDAVDDTQR